MKQVTTNYLEVKQVKGFSLKDFPVGTKVLLGRKQNHCGNRIAFVAVEKVARVGKASFTLSNGLTMKIWDYNGTVSKFWDGYDFTKKTTVICEVNEQSFEAHYIEIFTAARYKLFKKQALEVKEANELARRVADAKLEVTNSFDKIARILDMQLYRTKKVLWIKHVCKNCKHYNAETRSCMTRYKHYDGIDVTLEDQKFDIEGCPAFETIMEVE